MNVGVVFRPQQPPEDLEAVVRAVDEAGVPELWLWEDCFLEGGLTTATAALAWSFATRRPIALCRSRGLRSAWRPPARADESWRSCGCVALRGASQPAPADI